MGYILYSFVRFVKTFISLILSSIDRYIDQIAVIADERKFVSALIVPVYGFVKDYAKEKGIAYSNMDELLQHSKIQALFRARIDTLQQQFAHYEQVKRFTLY